MSHLEYGRSYVYDPDITYTENVLVEYKGRELEYSGLRLGYVTSLDLSSNKLSGDIPREITSLIEMRSLNLSRNHLVGTIPDGLSDIEYLESLDLSWNELTCTIPGSFSSLVYLSFLDLSHNRLSGKIPRGNQLETFDASSYMENPNLCGPPLSSDCLINGSYEDPNCEIKNEQNEGTEEDGGDSFEIPSFYMSMGLGYIGGFCGICGLTDQKLLEERLLPILRLLLRQDLCDCGGLWEEIDKEVSENPCW